MKNRSARAVKASETSIGFCRDVVEVLDEVDLRKKLRLPRSLRVKIGIMPIEEHDEDRYRVLWQKMKEFQDAGHKGILVIEDFWLSSVLPQAGFSMGEVTDYASVLRNASAITRSALSVLDPDKTVIQFDGEWMEKISYREILRLSSNIQIRDLLGHNYFAIFGGQRNLRMAMNEAFYPLMCALDSMTVQADIEIGGKAQLKNMRLARKLQRQEQRPALAGLVMDV